MNKKQTIRLNESQLQRVISEAVKRMLNEVDRAQLMAYYAKEREKQANGQRPLSQAMQRKGTTSSQLQDKARIGRIKAAQEFNSRYGTQSSHDGVSMQHHMRPDFSIVNSFDSNDNSGYGNQAPTYSKYGQFDVYNPNSDEMSKSFTGYDKNGNANTTTTKIPNYTKIGGGNEQHALARKMAQGSLDETIRKVVNKTLMSLL